jgi:hypothetical protein
MWLREEWCYVVDWVHKAQNTNQLLEYMNFNSNNIAINKYSINC